MNRHFSPPEERKPVLLADDLKHAHRERSLQDICREKEHADTVVALIAELNAHGLRCLLKEGVGNLGENTNAVADFPRRVLACTMLQLLHDCERVVQGAVIFVAVDIDNGTDAAGVVLKIWIIEHLFSLCHKFSSLCIGNNCCGNNGCSQTGKAVNIHLSEDKKGDDPPCMFAWAAPSPLINCICRTLSA